MASTAASPIIYDQKNTSITVSRNQPEFIIKLVSNPTTGYTWSLSEYNKALLTPVTQHYEAPNTRLVGAPGFDLFTFKMKPEAFTAPQRTTIKLIYSRPWEKNGNANEVEFAVSTN